MQFFLKNNDEYLKDENKIIIREKETLHHLNVLRIKTGEVLEVIYNNVKYITKIEKIANDEIFLNIIKKIKLERNDTKYILVQGIPKSKKLELITEKTTEIGIDEIIPVELLRSIVKKNDYNKKKIERLKLKAQSAAIQSKRKNIPIIKESIDFKELLDYLEKKEKNSYIIIFYEESKNKLKDIINEIKNKEEHKEENKEKEIIIIIGPEGGIDKSEIEKLETLKNKFLKKNNLNIYFSSLGENILRTETAPINAISIIKYEFE